MATLGLLAGVTVLLGVIAWRAHEFFAALEPVVAGGTGGERGPLVSVIVPARNEAQNIARCLQSVCEQDYSDLEILVIDDNSTDDTPRILARVAENEPRLSVLAGAPLAPGWTGKNFALAQAASHAQGEWLLFLDADTWLEPGTIGAAMAHASERKLGLLSLVTHQELAGFWERVIQPVVLLVIALALPLRAVNDSRRPGVAYANGQFLLVRGAAYEKAGGHAAEPASVVEDSALARAVKAAGFDVQLADGRELVHVRMYRGLEQTWEGWSKNSFLSAGRRLRNVALLVLSISALILVPPILLLVGLRELMSPNHADSGAVLTSAVAALQWALAFYLTWRCEREVGVPGRYAFTAPLGAAMFNALLCYSAYRILSGHGVSWKGRRYHA
jgi:chlorobactene glucosyltransferase